jgi:hypothetical protein
MNAVFGGWQELLNPKSSLPGHCPWPFRLWSRLTGVLFLLVRVCYLLVVCVGFRFFSALGPVPAGPLFLPQMTHSSLVVREKKKLCSLLLWVALFRFVVFLLECLSGGKHIHSFFLSMGKMYQDYCVSLVFYSWLRHTALNAWLKIKSNYVRWSVQNGCDKKFSCGYGCWEGLIDPSIFFKQYRLHLNLLCSNTLHMSNHGYNTFDVFQQMPCKQSV